MKMNITGYWNKLRLDSGAFEACCRNAGFKDELLELFYKNIHQQTDVEVVATSEFFLNVFFLYRFLKTFGPEQRIPSLFLAPGVNIPERLVGQKEEIVGFLADRGLRAVVTMGPAKGIHIPHAWHMEVSLAA